MADLKRLADQLDKATRKLDSLRREVARIKAEAGLIKKRGRKKYAGTLTLSPAETRVLKHLLRGLSNRDIGKQLHISERTVKFHLQGVYKKLNVKSRIELIQKHGDRTLPIPIEAKPHEAPKTPDTLPIGRRTA